MKKLLLIPILSLLFVNLSANAQENPAPLTKENKTAVQNTATQADTANKMRPHPHKFNREANRENMKKFDEMIAQRLNLTEEQKAKIEKDKKKNQKELQKIFNEMQKERKEIRNVYMTGIPKYQADVRTSASKAKLALLNQKAHAIREDNRKNFESVLTAEQKTEFEKIKQEIRDKREQNRKNRPHHKGNMNPKAS